MSQPRHRSVARLARLGRVTVPEAPHTRAEEPSRGAPRTPRGLAREGARPGGGSGALGAPAAGRDHPPGSGGGGMRLPELCLALLCAAVAGTDSPGAAREQPPGAAAAAGRAAEAGRGGPGAAAPRAGGVDPRQAWMLLAGSPGQASSSRARGRTGTVRDGTGAGTAPVPASGRSPGESPPAAWQVGVPGAVPGPPSVPEELGRELQLLLKGTHCPRGPLGGGGGGGAQVKTRRKAWEGREEEEESEGNPQAGSHRRVEAAFRCQTCENISIEQRARLELQLYYIPEREGMFHRGPGLNLTSGQYTAPITGYYTFTATPQSSWGNRLRVLICAQSCCQHNGYCRAQPSGLESGSDHVTISAAGVLYLQVSGASSTRDCGRKGAGRRLLWR
uniref:Erythroferrone n=1 Tax=Falco tinnunculus TaxID=100819 RepID=A0A8C4TVV5_FALTI